MSKIEIEVTKDDIRAGCRGKMDSCAVAIACCRALNKRGIVVDGERVTWPRADGNGSEWIALPEAAIEWIAKFDVEQTKSPISFELDTNNLCGV